MAEFESRYSRICGKGLHVRTLKKRLILYETVFLQQKIGFYRLKTIPNAYVAYVLFHKSRYIYTTSYIAVLQGVNLPHPPLIIRGST